ncbi:hypothetical protein AVP41_02116 [Microbacterium sp. TNHR37B]|nr:hypothetical protein AVP41_02116 [Microbacterium sp. TNHR37B]
MSVRSRVRVLALTTATGALLATASACAPEPAPPTPSTPPVSAASPTPSAAGAPVLADFPFAPSESTTPLPDDCRAILTESVLSELGDVPLNAPGMGGGIRPDSTRVCAWGEPGAAGTWLVTRIGFSPFRAASDALYELGREGFTCYEPGGGIRCERTWPHETLPVTQGRTVYYRDGIVIDTQYSNLAPAGYTNAIIASMWPAGGAPRPSPSPSTP